MNIAPNQSAMPDAAFPIYCLGMSRDRRGIGAWQRVVDLLDPKEEDFKSLTQGTYYYADSVCFGAQRLGDPAAIPVLEKLHAYPTLHGLVSPKGAQEDMILERRAWLELVIGAALARCGSPRGFDILISYLNDCRRLLARQAHSQLVSMTGRDCGIDSRAWLSWLKSGAAPGPSPLLVDPDAAFEPWILLEA